MAKETLNDKSEPRLGLMAPVYEALKEQLMDQTLKAGGKLNIDALALKLEVSPTPVREALVKLSAEGLVSFTPYKGFTVSSLLSRKETADLMHVRKLIETEAAKAATARIGLLALHEMDAVLSRIEQLQLHLGSQFREYQQFNELDRRFHELLVTAADNTTLLDVYRSLNVHVQLARFFRNNGGIGIQIDATNEEHRAIYRALNSHDSAAAVQAVCVHLDNAYIRTAAPEGTFNISK